jgi:8-oxo-dGTP diphosphatase
MSQQSQHHQQQHVRVGVGVLVKDPKSTTGKVFAGRRKGSHGAGTLALPGGHLEMFETWHECAIREVREEMGIDISNVMFVHVTNDLMESEGKHYITIFMLAEFVDRDATPINCEPQKCEGWDSYSWDELMQICDGKDESGLSLFGPLRHLVEEEPEKIRDFLNIRR